jgi:hypothetical protein
MSQLENMPGGFNALANMYESVQAPLESMGGGGNDTSTNNNTARSSSDAGLPEQRCNPWGLAPTARLFSSYYNRSQDNSWLLFLSFNTIANMMSMNPNANPNTSNANPYGSRWLPMVRTFQQRCPYASFANPQNPLLCRSQSVGLHDWA